MTKKTHDATHDVPATPRTPALDRSAFHRSSHRARFGSVERSPQSAQSLNSVLDQFRTPARRTAHGALYSPGDGSPRGGALQPLLQPNTSPSPVMLSDARTETPPERLWNLPNQLWQSQELSPEQSPGSPLTGTRPRTLLMDQFSRHEARYGSADSPMPRQRILPPPGAPRLGPAIELASESDVFGPVQFIPPHRRARLSNVRDESPNALQPLVGLGFSQRELMGLVASPTLDTLERGPIAQADLEQSFFSPFSDESPLSQRVSSSLECSPQTRSELALAPHTPSRNAQADQGSLPPTPSTTQSQRYRFLFGRSPSRS